MSTHDQLAIEGGKPVREKPLSYGRQLIEESDIVAVSDVQLSDRQTNGLKVEVPEEILTKASRAQHILAEKNGITALYETMFVQKVCNREEATVQPICRASNVKSDFFQYWKPVFNNLAEACHEIWKNFGVQKVGTKLRLCPIDPFMSESDQDDVVLAVEKVFNAWAR